MVLYIGGLLLCAIVLLFASKIVYRQLAEIAEKVHAPVFIVSLLLVALSTSIPELFVGITSALQGTPSFSLGDILGSNIVNLTFIAGLVILLGRKAIVLPDNISTKLLLSTFAVASIPVLMLFDGTLSRIDGAILVCAYAAYVYFIVSDSRHHMGARVGRARGLVKPLVFFAVGVVLLIGAAEIIIRIASAISTDLHVAPFIIGVFAIALSTSLPELSFGLRSAFQQNPQLSLADVVGSTAVNASGILGVVALIHPITPIDLSGALFTGFFGIFVYIAFFLVVGQGRVNPRRGAVLLVLYLIFASLNLVV